MKTIHPNPTQEEIYKQTLLNLRRQLNPRQRLLSRWFHARGVEVVWELLDETLFRPSLIVGGFTGALLLGVGGYALAWQNGWLLPLYVLPAGFVMGAVIGLCIEKLKLRRRVDS